jgi:hypothetical protein
VHILAGARVVIPSQELVSLASKILVCESNISDSDTEMHLASGSRGAGRLDLTHLHYVIMISSLATPPWPAMHDLLHLETLRLSIPLR